MTEKTNNIIAIIAIIGLVAALLVVSFSDKNENQNSLQKEIISVSGTSEIEVNPDQAIVYLNVNTEGLVARSVQEQNKGIANAVIDALKKSGVTADQIETSNYYLNKKTEWDMKTQTYVDKGYILTHTLKVTTTDIDNVGKIIDAAVNAGANGVDSVSFGLTKASETDVKAQAMIKATQAAKDKAQSLASTLNVNLGKVNSVSENNFYYAPYNYAPNYAEAAKMDAGMMSSTSVSPQKVIVTSSVSIAYELEQ